MVSEITDHNVLEVLKSISTKDGVDFFNAHTVYKCQASHRSSISSLNGYLIYADALKCFFLDTLSIVNVWLENNKFSLEYHLFLTTISGNFRTLCASENATANGYPHEAFSLLRNVFESTIQLSAALQKHVSFQDVSGLNYDGTVGSKNKHEILNKIRKNKLAIDHKVNDFMFGKTSGLTTSQQEILKDWDDMFDFEIHGSRFSNAKNIFRSVNGYPSGSLPHFEKKHVGLFINRYLMISWLSARLLPCFQTGQNSFSSLWKNNYHVLDQCLHHYSKKLKDEENQDIGHVISEFLDKKFPFDENSTFPTVISEMPS